MEELAYFSPEPFAFGSNTPALGILLKGMYSQQEFPVPAGGSHR